MPEVVALDLPPGPAFVEALRGVWDTGDAAAPLDHRLPKAAAQVLVEALRPSRMVGPDGAITTVAGGQGCEAGDALVVATSGSSETPKAAVLTHAAVAASARATSARLGIDPQRHIWLACLPLAHIGGLAVVCRSVVTGTPVVVTAGFEAEAVTALGRSGRVTHVSLVATALRRVAAEAFTTILLGGSAPPGSLPANVVTTYGMTETGSGVVYDGRPLDGVDVAVTDGGELLVRGPMLLRSYRHGPAALVVGPDGHGDWLATGDGGSVAADGTVRVDGRLAEVIVTGGEKVWPAAVEAVLATHASVAEVAVWKRPDAEWGEAVTAWVVPADPAEPPALEAFRDHLAAQLPRWAAPRALVVVGELPRTPSGKVSRRQLP